MTSGDSVSPNDAAAAWLQPFADQKTLQLLADFESAVYTNGRAKTRSPARSPQGGVFTCGRLREMQSDSTSACAQHVQETPEPRIPYCATPEFDTSGNSGLPIGSGSTERGIAAWDS